MPRSSRLAMSYYLYSLRTDGSRLYTFAPIYINLLAGSHQPRALSYISHLKIASEYLCQAPSSPSSPICLAILPLRHPIQPPESKHHVTLSSLYPRSPRICHLDLRIACTRHKWGACRNRKACHTYRKGNVLPLISHLIS